MLDRIPQLNDAFHGRYVIQRELGAGGMATVYLAEDVKHRRKVAIKVLRDDLSASVGIARFQREIEIAAQLQHPNILPLLDSGEANGLLYFVMPYVEGQSLRQRLNREHELPVGEAVRLLVEIVDALTHAHQRGVVHRDIKPDNVMLSGRHALVTDFGVARAVSEATGGNTLTTLGVALGTPAYMSPEQATADPDVDHRADIYAVGIVAYELLAGRLPFTASSPQKVLAAHVTETPEPVSKYRPGLPPALSHAVMRCLEKRPADRWQTASDLLAALEPLATPSGGLAPTEARIAAVRAPSRRRYWTIGGSAVVVAGLAALVLRATRPVTPSIAIGRSTQLTTAAGLQIEPAISPDGKLVAYAAGNSARTRIFIRPAGGGRTIPLSDDSTAAELEPRWSPDGSQISFLVHDGVSVASALGGQSRAIIAGNASRPVRTASWSPDGREIAFARAESLFVASADGQTTRFVAAGRDILTWCRWSPRGSLIACVDGNSMALALGATFANKAPSSIVVVPSTGGTFKRLTDDKTTNQAPEWSSSGERLFFISNRDGPLDVYEHAINSDGSARGPAMRLTTGLNARALSMSADDRRLAYAVYAERSNIWALPIPVSGTASASSASPLTTGSQIIESMSVSRDGRWLVYDSDRDGTANIYRIPISGGQAEQLTHERFDVFAPSLSAAGLLAYHSFRTGTRNIEVKPLDGGPVEFVTNTPAQESDPVWSPDGTQIAFLNQVNHAVLVTKRLAPGTWSKPVQVIGVGGRPSWTPDGRHLVMAMGDSIIVMPLDTGVMRTVYTARADDAVPDYAIPSADGRVVFFKSHDAEGRAAFYAVPIAGGQPHVMVRFPDPDRPSYRADFAVDAERFYFPVQDRQSNIWLADLTRR